MQIVTVDLKSELEKRVLTQHTLSRITGVHSSDISKLAAGKVPAYPSWRRSIAKALGMKEEELFGERKA